MSHHKSEAARASLKKHYLKKKITEIIHLQKGRTTLCNKNILYNTNVTNETNKITCSTCKRMNDGQGE